MVRYQQDFETPLDAKLRNSRLRRPFTFVIALWLFGFCRTKARYVRVAVLMQSWCFFMKKPFWCQHCGFVVDS